jgi:hypothetical protein
MSLRMVLVHLPCFYAHLFLGETIPDALLIGLYDSEQDSNDVVELFEPLSNARRTLEVDTPAGWRCRVEGRAGPDLDRLPTDLVAGLGRPNLEPVILEAQLRGRCGRPPP